MKRHLTKNIIGIIATIIIFALIVAGIVAWQMHRIGQAKKMFASMKVTPVVSAIVVKPRDIPNYLSTVGSLKASNDVDILPETSGIVEKIYFKSGDYVEKGTLLVDLDASEQLAKLASDKSQLSLTKINYQRNKKLYKQKAVAEQSLDESLANYQQAQAAVKLDDVLIQQKHIRAPFSGRVGIRKISVGQYLTTVPGSNASVIVNMQSLDPLYVDFTLPQKNLADLHVGQVVELTVDAFPTGKFTGKITALNAGVNEQSRMISVRAEVPNPDHKLFGGMFAYVKVSLPMSKNIIAVSPTAVNYNVYGDTAYVAVRKGDKWIAEQRFITVGERRGDFTIITKGLKGGDNLIINGQLKLYPGADIRINDGTAMHPSAFTTGVSATQNLTKAES